MRRYQFLAEIKGRKILYNPETRDIAEEVEFERLIGVDNPEILVEARGLIAKLKQQKAE
jgi:hypothetical protein